MASSNYTANLHLSDWAETDRPKRADFVADNNIIDSALGGHIANSGIHVTAAEKAKISEPFAVAVYAGSGASQRTISLAFTPSFVIVYKRDMPAVTYSNGESVAHSACASYGHGAAYGLSITTSGVIVNEDSSANQDGVRASLNESGSQYTVIAFK